MSITTTAPITTTVSTVTYGAGKAVHLGDPSVAGAPICGRTKGGEPAATDAAVTCGHCVRAWAKGEFEVATQLPEDYYPAIEVPDSPAELVATPGFADPNNIPADERYAQGDRRNQIAYDRHERKAQKIAREVAAYGWTATIEHLPNEDGTAQTLLHLYRGDQESIFGEYLRVGYADGGCDFSENLYKGRGRTYRPRNASAARQIAAMDPPKAETPEQDVAAEQA